MILDADFAVSIRDLIYIIGLLGGGYGVWFGMKYKINDASEKVKKALETAVESKEKMADLKLELFKEYPTNSHLRELETRLTTSIGGLGEEIRQLRNYIIDRKE